MNNVISFRPRREVTPRRIPSVRTEAPEYRTEEAHPLTVAAGVPFLKLWKALHAGGFALVFDQRTSCFLVREREQP